MLRFRSNSLKYWSFKSLMKWIASSHNPNNHHRNINIRHAALL